MPKDLDSKSFRVLVIGRRQGLEAVLRRRGIPFALWVERGPRAVSRDVPVLEAPFVRTREAVAAALEALRASGPFTHCIAAVEAAVVTASHARRVLGARKSPHTVARRCHDKLIMKQRLREAGVPVTDFLDLNREDEKARVGELGVPLVVKDRVSSGSRGVEILHAPTPDHPALDVRGRLAERFLPGTEMSVESFVADDEIVWTNPTRYWRPKHVNVVPAGLDDDLRAAVLDLNRRALEALRVRFGMTHLELFITDRGLFVGEVALRPPGGYLMRCLELAYGFDPWDALCSVELGEPFAPPTTPGRPTAAVILHPGAGRVAAIRGLETVREHPACVDARLKVAVGDDIDERIGVGQDIGRVLLQAQDTDALDEAIRFVERELVVDLEAVDGAQSVEPS